MKGQETKVLGCHKNIRDISVSAYHLNSQFDRLNSTVIIHHYHFDLVIITLLLLHKDSVKTYPNNYFNPLSNQIIKPEQLPSINLDLLPS